MDHEHFEEEEVVSWREVSEIWNKACLWFFFFHVYDVYFQPCFYDNFVSGCRNTRRSLGCFHVKVDWSPLVN